MGKHELVSTTNMIHIKRKNIKINQKSQKRANTYLMKK